MVKNILHRTAEKSMLTVCIMLEKRRWLFRSVLLYREAQYSGWHHDHCFLGQQTLQRWCIFFWIVLSTVRQLALLLCLEPHFLYFLMSTWCHICTAYLAYTLESAGSVSVVFIFKSGDNFSSARKFDFFGTFYTCSAWTESFKCDCLFKHLLACCSDAIPADYPLIP